MKLFIQLKMALSRRVIVKNKDSLDRLISYCIKTGYCSFDFETTSVEYYREGEYPTVLAVCFQPGISYIIPLGHSASPFKDNYVEILQYFGKKVLENPQVVKIAWNLQFELNWCRTYSIYPKGRLFDAMIAKYLLDETRPNDLKSMVARFIPEFAGYDDEVDLLARKHGWANIPFEPLTKYAGIDADMELRLWLKFEPLLIQKGLYKLFRNLMMPALQVLSESAFNGVNINEERLLELRSIYEKETEDIIFKLTHNPKFVKYDKARKKNALKYYIAELQNEISELRDQARSDRGAARKIANRESKIQNITLGQNLTKKEEKLFEPFNFGSQTQLKDLLFLNPKGFRFKIVKYTLDQYKNSTGNPSTDEEVLEKLKLKDDSGFIELMLKHREILHIRSNFIESYLEKLYKGKLHPSFLLHGTVSGRLSSRNPNAQQVPRVTTNPHIKPLFIPSPGKLIMQMDYSQAELRVLASMAQEKEMIRWFAEGRDIHLSSACKKYKVDYNTIKPILKDENHPEHTTWVIRRKQAKQINFGIVYGQGAKMLAGSLSSIGVEVTEEQAQKFLDDFFKEFPQIRKFIKMQHRKALKYGFVTSPFGRKRRLPEINSPNWGVKAEAQRQSVNAPIQGTASDYTLFASVLIWEKIKSGLLPLGMKQLITVHDSLIFELYPEDIHEVIRIIKPLCEYPETKEWFDFELKGITMAVDFEIGTTWGDLKDYDENIDYTTWV